MQVPSKNLNITNFVYLLQQKWMTASTFAHANFYEAPTTCHA